MAQGLEMSTTSDEACKMYDATLTQLVNHFDDDGIGGTSTCMEKMLKADPEFLLGHVIKLGVSGQQMDQDYKFAQEVYHMMELSRKPTVKPWERKHAEAVKLFSEGKIKNACLVWEDILVEKPTDMLSLKFLHDMYIVNGMSQGLRDSCSRALPHWKPYMPFYGDLLGMYAFGLEEMNMYSQAEKTARQALEINRHDAWASHCVAHVKDMTGQYKKGIEFMSETENNWNDTALLCHNYWHWALYYVETGDFESAIGILDNHVMPFLKKSESSFSLTDAASLMFRLEAEGFDGGSRWNDCHSVAKHHLSGYVFSYIDINCMLSCLRAKNPTDCGKLMDNVKQSIKDNIKDVAHTNRDVAIPIMEAFTAYENQNFDKAVEIMKPLKYQIHQVGGSHAQRDLMNLLTIHAGRKSQLPENQKYARQLLLERKQAKEECPLAERLLQNLIIAH